MSAKYLSCEEASGRAWARRPIPPPGAGPSHHRHADAHTPARGPGRPHVLGLDAGLLGADVAVVLVPPVVSLAFFHPPLPLRHNEPGEVGVQLVLLVDAPLLNAVPALLLSDAQSTRDVIPEVEPLLLGEVIGNGLVIEEVCLHRLPVQLQGPPAVCEGLLMLLHLQVAQCPVGVVHCHQRIPAGRRLRILAAHEEPVALLLELLRARAFFGASAAGAQPRAALLLLLALHGAARHCLGSAPRLRVWPPAARARDPLGPGPAIRPPPSDPPPPARSGRGGAAFGAGGVALGRRPPPAGLRAGSRKTWWASPLPRVSRESWAPRRGRESRPVRDRVCQVSPGPCP
uniref:Uncharacterized protein n=1 Tax=Suricata suricatta TaxID=37032 RepID=A0A673U6L6_SURSU